MTGHAPFTAANELKSEGNILLKTELFQEAVEKYTEALLVLRETANDSLTPDTQKEDELAKLEAIVYCNRSTAHLLLRDAEEAVKDARACVARDPANWKGFKLLEKALRASGDEAGAAIASAECTRLRPSKPSAQPTAKKKGFLLSGSSLYADKEVVAGLDIEPRIPDVVLFGSNCIQIPDRKCDMAYAGQVGLANLGNSCFINAVLQTFMYTTPLINVLDEVNPSSLSLGEARFDMMVELEKLLTAYRDNAAKANTKVVRPVQIVKHLKSLSTEFQYGMQEDAHMFLCFAIDALQRSCLYGYTDKVTPDVEKSTLAYKLFGHQHKNSVVCSNSDCRHQSDTHNAAFELHFDAINISQSDKPTISTLIQEHFATEHIEDYKCEKCKQLGIDKGHRISEPPLILPITLQRCGAGMFGKSNVHVEFDESVDISSIVENPASSCVYDLYGVVVHFDIMNSTFFGHYVAYCKDMQGTWWLCDDENVSQVSWEQVKRNNAFMLLYQQRDETTMSAAAAL